MGCFVSIEDTTLGTSLIGHTFRTKQTTCLTFHNKKYLLGRSVFDNAYKKVDVGFFSLELKENIEFNVISIVANGPHLTITAEITNNISINSLGQLREYKSHS